jgi:hypothetical protein
MSVEKSVCLTAAATGRVEASKTDGQTRQPVIRKRTVLTVCTTIVSWPWAIYCGVWEKRSRHPKQKLQVREPPLLDTC